MSNHCSPTWRRHNSTQNTFPPPQTAPTFLEETKGALLASKIYLTVSETVFGKFMQLFVDSPRNLGRGGEGV